MTRICKCPHCTVDFKLIDQIEAKIADRYHPAHIDCDRREVPRNRLAISKKRLRLIPGGRPARERSPTGPFIS